MIAMLAGLVDQAGDDGIVIDVNGVGYLVFASSRTLGKAPARGEPIRLLIETHVREDHIHLYGFVDEAEREWFRLLTTVQGVGARIALAILSALVARGAGDGDRGAGQGGGHRSRRRRTEARPAHRQRAQGQGRRHRSRSRRAGTAGGGERGRVGVGQSRLSAQRCACGDRRGLAPPGHRGVARRADPRRA